MSAQPREITAASVQVVLAHLCPLIGPLPPHLVSRPLLQRHHFLALSPDSAEEYLAWPSPDRSRAVHLLQSLQLPSHDQPFSVQYTADAEHITAHVRITPNLRLLFLWDPRNTWQYHNAALMPFPSNSYTTLSDAFAAYSADDFLPEQGFNLKVAVEDDDSYWNAYGGGDDDDHLPASGKSQDSSLNSEDAYWAQYSSVQGSGDSTMPSPLPTKKKFGQDADAVQTGRIIVPSDDFRINHVEPYNPLEPPAPSSLARRLAELANEPGASSPPLFDDSTTTDSNTASPQLTEAVPANEERSPSFSPQQQPAESFVVVDVQDPVDTTVDPSQDVLRENLKNLYRLWKLGRHDNSVEEDKDLFLTIAKQAVEEL
ncbi:unnamed protein product [Cyclocybe aegerita]|uniref:Uncharacterized protein n=1 Tax=Cyclocybe aegerita TaxID=1973307 RepID=A0A8S0XMW0_CYCAE|nr:unnamed protein product [Cyclocybe aegerita]